jgi:hypothetical protein
MARPTVKQCSSAGAAAFINNLAVFSEIKTLQVFQLGATKKSAVPGKTEITQPRPRHVCPLLLCRSPTGQTARSEIVFLKLILCR